MPIDFDLMDDLIKDEETYTPSTVHPILVQCGHNRTVENIKDYKEGRWNQSHSDRFNIPWKKDFLYYEAKGRDIKQFFKDIET